MSGAELLKSNRAEIRFFWQQKGSDCEPAVNKRNAFNEFKIKLALIYSGESWRCDREITANTNRRQSEEQRRFRLNSGSVASKRRVRVKVNEKTQIDIIRGRGCALKIK